MAKKNGKSEKFNEMESEVAAADAEINRSAHESRANRPLTLVPKRMLSIFLLSDRFPPAQRANHLLKICWMMCAGL
jgi:hypothetical protein